MEKLVDDIRTFFPEFRINTNDLKNPTATFVRDFFCIALLELGVDLDNVRKIQIQQLDAQEVDIIPELNLVSAIRTAFPFLGFRLNDLISPEIKRNVHLMSHVMAFLHFCEIRCAANNNQIEEIQEARNAEMELVKTVEKESNQLNNLAREVDNNVQAQERLENDIEKLQEEVERYKVEQNGISEGMQEMQDLLEAKATKINSLEKEIQLKLIEFEELRKLIVINPEDEERDLDVKSKDREKVLERKREYQDKLKSLNENKEMLQKLSEILTKKVKPIVQELHVLQEYSKLKDVNEKSEENVKELQNEKEELLKSIEEIEKKFEVDEKNTLKRIAELEKEEPKLKEMVEMKRSEYKSKSKEVKQALRSSTQELEKVLNRISSIENDYECFLIQFNLAKELAFANLNGFFLK